MSVVDLRGHDDARSVYHSLPALWATPRYPHVPLDSQTTHTTTTSTTASFQIGALQASQATIFPSDPYDVDTRIASYLERDLPMEL